VHQEDLCQALGIDPGLKYENQGGPGAKSIFSAIAAHSDIPDDDGKTFISALIFNWLIAGTDAHAKNYSILLGVEGQVRLAPFYDMASILPYDRIDLRKAKSAMRIGGKYLLNDIGRRQWGRFANDVSVNPETVTVVAHLMAREVAQAAPEVAAACRARGLTHPIIDRLSDLIVERAHHCARLMELNTSA